MSGAPQPPPDLAQRKPLIRSLKRGTTLHRFYTEANEPVYFDRSLNGRFNAPDGTYGTMYVAETLGGAFAETFLRVPGRTLLPQDMVDAKAYVRLRLKRPLGLIQLAGRGLARIGATAEALRCSPKLVQGPA